MGLRSYPYSQLERRDRDSVTPRGQRSARTPDTPPTGFSGADRNPNTRAGVDRRVSGELTGAAGPKESGGSGDGPLTAADITVVVPTRDRPTFLARCLADLTEAQQGDGLGAVLVVDSASRSTETGTVASRFGVPHVWEPLPGASRARNAGWRAAQTPLVAFIDDDLRLRSGWTSAIVEAFQDPSVAFVTGQVVLPEGAGAQPQAFGVIEGHAGRTLDGSTRGVFGGSANLAVRRAVISAVGGFDERLGPGRWLSAGEDVELLDRLVEAGWIGRYEPAAIVECEQWRDDAQRLRLAWSYGKGMGARFAAMGRRDPARAVRRSPEVLRLSGITTAVREIKARAQHGRPRATVAPAAHVPGSRRSLGEPLLWRAGALTGLAAGLVILGQDPR
jgi:GT2 family glycosyltransferase